MSSRQTSGKARRPTRAVPAGNRTSNRSAATRREKTRSGPPLTGIVAVAIVLVILIGLVGVKLITSGGRTANVDNQPVPATVLTALQQVPPATFNAVGRGGSGAQPIVLPGPPLTSGGKPEVLYIGAEYCPYCAAERWAMVVALSRFGQFSGLATMTSSATDVYPSTPTFTFTHASYTSDYLAFAAVELESNQPSGNGYRQLQTPTAAQQQIFQRFDAPPYVAANATQTIPFVDIANRVMFNGTPYSPQVLHGETWDQIAQAIQQPGNADAQAIIGTANVLTAAVCAADNNQPANVCSSAVIQQLRPAAS